MPRLRTPPSLAQLAVNTVSGFFAVGLFFGVIYLAEQDGERERIQEALDAHVNPETRLQRAARAVCNDAAEQTGRRAEPRWSAAGELECITVIAQEVHQ